MTVPWRVARAPGETEVEGVEILAVLTTGGATRAGMAGEAPRLCASAAKLTRNIATSATAKWTFLVILHLHKKMPKAPLRLQDITCISRKS